jgi:hypothetical protein
MNINGQLGLYRVEKKEREREHISVRVMDRSFPTRTAGVLAFDNTHTKPNQVLVPAGSTE